MKILITGGAGFIGFHLSKYLSESDYDVTVCDNLFRGKMDYEFKNLIEKKNIKFIRADLTNKEEFNKFEKNYDCVYHLAAVNGTKYFYEMPHEVLRINILSLINLLEWMVNTDCNKMVWTSSSETYAGTIKTGNVAIPTPEDVPLTIEDVFNPRFSYAGSKIIGELLCVNYARKYDFNFTIIRPHNIYGPRMGHKHVIPEFIERVTEKIDPFNIYGAEQSRAFCFIEDFVRGLKMSGESSQADEQVVNIGDDREEIKIIDLAQKIFEISGFHPELEILPSPEGSVVRRCPDITKARKLLGYEPQINLNAGLRKTYDWYRNIKEV